MYLDVIGIGAINYDYIFFCKKLEYRNRSMPEFGQEYLSSDESTSGLRRQPGCIRRAGR